MNCLLFKYELYSGIRIFARFTAVFLFSITGNAQKPGKQIDKGFVTYSLGTDTTTMQYFEFHNRNFKTTIITLSGQVTKLVGTGELDRKGDINYVKSSFYHQDSIGNWQLVSEAVHEYKNDSSIYTSVSAGDGKVLVRRAIPAKGIVTNAADGCSFFVFPYMGFFAPSGKGDTLFHCQLSFGECRTYHVARLSKTELKIGSNVMGRIKLYVDKKGRMTRADAVGSSLNFIANVRRGNIDYQKLMEDIVMTKFVRKDFAPRTYRDTAVLLLQGKKIEIDYWRPYRRGRQIFGTVVPWGKVWRTGANNSTQLRTGTALSFGESKLPAGKYSLWTYPAENGWDIIFNKKAAVWGTEYDAKEDILKIPLSVQKVSEPAEVLTISLQKQNENKGRILIEWEYYKAWIDFIIE